MENLELPRNVSLRVRDVLHESITDRTTTAAAQHGAAHNERVITMISDIIGQLATGSADFTTGSAVADGGFDLIGTALAAFEGLLTSFGS